MNPNEARVVKLTNPFDFDYTHAYGGVPYQLRAGSTQLFPWAIGDHLATHLARQAIIRKAPLRDENAADGRGGESTRSDRPLWDDTAIDELKKKILSEAYTEEVAPPTSDAEMWKKKFDELNAKIGLNPEVIKATAETPVVSSSDLPIQPPADNDHVAAGASQFPAADGKTYQDKQEVIAALTKKGIKFDARSSKATLEKLLA